MFASDFPKTSDAVRNPRFCQLLDGVYYSNIDDAWRKRLDEVRGVTTEYQPRLNGQEGL